MPHAAHRGGPRRAAFLPPACCCLLLLLLMQLPSSSAAEPAPVGSGGDVIDTAKLGSLLGRHSCVVVLFDAPWCGDCRPWRLAWSSLVPRVASAFASHAGPPLLLHANALLPANAPFAESHGVRDYPTVLAFVPPHTPSGDTPPTPYHGECDVYTLLDFVTELAASGSAAPCLHNPTTQQAMRHLSGGEGEGGGDGATPPSHTPVTPVLVAGLFVGEGRSGGGGASEPQAVGADAGVAGSGSEGGGDPTLAAFAEAAAGLPGAAAPLVRFAAFAGGGGTDTTPTSTSTSDAECQFLDLLSSALSPNSAGGGGTAAPPPATPLPPPPPGACTAERRASFAAWARRALQLPPLAETTGADTTPHSSDTPPDVASTSAILPSPLVVLLRGGGGGGGGGTATVLHAPTAAALLLQVESLALPAVVPLSPQGLLSATHTAAVVVEAFLASPSAVKAVYFPEGDTLGAAEAAVLRRAAEEGAPTLRIGWVASGDASGVEFFAAGRLGRPCVVLVDAEGRRFAETVGSRFSYQDILLAAEEVEAGVYTAEQQLIRSEPFDFPRLKHLFFGTEAGEGVEEGGGGAPLILRMSSSRYTQLVEKTVEKTICVLFYLPWCQFSSQMLQAFQELGLAYATMDSVLLVTFDASKNDIPDTAKPFVRGFPTALLYTRSMKGRGIISPFTYDGNTTSAGLSNFILRHNEHRHSYHRQPGEREVLQADALSTAVPPGEFGGGEGGGGGGGGGGDAGVSAALLASLSHPLVISGGWETTLLQCLLWSGVYIPLAVVGCARVLQWGVGSYRARRCREAAAAYIGGEAGRPDLLPMVDRWVAQYDGHEELLIPHLRKKYG